MHIRPRVISYYRILRSVSFFNTDNIDIKKAKVSMKKVIYFSFSVRVDIVENNIPLQDSGKQNSHEENPPEKNYWTIVSNADGELSTAVEINTEQITEQDPVCNRTVGQIEELPQIHRLEFDMELDGYIHPIHSNPLNTSCAPTHNSTDI
ncbi:hypothetical protein CHS0354_040415 [Potamilus streckersoni]|uniref:Uncharacterized protein n=1 Tax=Potamilus streckersoni TaxID=2493646 RepID=A0AAE0W5I5_9BIVA|nr:hypothetical protein CHS0354_040415 [Potamilus streckersoni]